MNGPAHYRAAEALIDVVDHTPWQGPEADTEFTQITLAAAQVHATLALTAATTFANVKAYLGPEAAKALEWAEVTKP